jgi:phosphoglycolate phosphatase
MAPPPEMLRIGPPAEKMVSNMIGQDADSVLVADIVSEFRRCYDASSYPETKLYPGAEKMLKQLKNAGIRLSIATYKGTVSTQRLLEIKGIAEMFDEILSSNLNGERWTKQRMLSHIMEATQTQAAETFFFGDSVGDIQAGRDHGIATVAVLYGYELPENLIAAGADFVCHSFAELLTSDA